ncbi:MAG: hypothetical protein WB662_12505 [Methyloceanibacter sp.]
MVDKAHLGRHGEAASNSEAGAPDQLEGVEITPKMIEAGVDVYLQHCPDTGAGDVLDCEMVKEIYLAMANLGAKFVIPSS